MGVTLNDFRRYRQLSKEAVRLKKQIDRLKENNNRRVKDKVSSSMDEHPYIKRSVTVRGKTDNTKAIKRREKELANLRAELLKLGAELNGFLKKVADREVRDTLIFYYLEGCRYCDIAYLLGLEGDGSWQMQKVRKYMSKNST